MSRIRSLKPEWLDDELLSTASSDARTLSIGLICLADDYGNGRAGRIQIANRVFPGKAPETLDNALSELVRIRYVMLYEVGGQRYFTIRNWDKHQRVDRPGAAKVPRPNLVSAEQDTEKILATESQELATESQEKVLGIPASRVPTPIPDPLILTQPDPDPVEKSRSPRARARRTVAWMKPFRMYAGWAPTEQFVEVQAQKFEVSAERVSALLPEFRYYWEKRGELKTEQNWERTFANQVARSARDGSLYAGRSGAGNGSPPPPGIKPRQPFLELQKAEREAAHANALRDAEERGEPVQTNLVGLKGGIGG